MHISEHARQTPRKVAIRMAATKQEMTFEQLEHASNQSAHALRSLGLRRGDVVATLFGNSPEVFVFGWAAQRTGLYSTSISNKLSDKDVAYIVRDSGAKLLVVEPAFAELALTAAEENPSVPVYSWGDSAHFENWLARSEVQPSSPVPDESAGTDLLYSSGTTGRPKGVKPPLPEGPVGAGTPITRMGSDLYGMGRETIYLSTSPLYHAAPLRWAMAVLQLGGEIVVMERFDAEQVLALVEKHRVTHGTFVPTHFVRMLQLPDEVRQSYDLASLSVVVHAAAPCPIPVKQAMIAWLGPILHEYYAGTESCGITALDSDEWVRKPGSVGRAVLGKLHVLADDGTELGSGEEGQIYFSDGPAFEYLNDPEKTAQAHNDKGWATLGDVGRVDEDGYLFLTDRKNFMIISGGVNIYPQEIENSLVMHPEVSDAAVFGVPCAEMGEKVVAIVEPRNDLDDPVELAESLRRYVRGELGGVKTPREFSFMRALPREPTGKLLKKRIREAYLAGEIAQLEKVPTP